MCLIYFNRAILPKPDAKEKEHLGNLQLGNILWFKEKVELFRKTKANSHQFPTSKRKVFKKQ